MPDTPESSEHALARMQARFNRSTREHWAHFAAHRQRIEELLLADGLGGGGRLCVLGAGNCNDLDLPRLIETFNEVHLVDLDPKALSAAVERQGVERVAQIRLHAPVDLTGVAQTLAAWPGKRPPGSEVDACIGRAANAPTPELGGPFDTVLSPCLLSQIAGYAADTLGRDHPRSLDLRRALRDRHIRLMVDLLGPGGVGVLVTDVASSYKVEHLMRAREDELPDLLNRLIARGDVFTGLEPHALEQVLSADPFLAAIVPDVRLVRPWAWMLGPQKAFLVYAMRFRKASQTVLLEGRAAARNGIILP